MGRGGVTAVARAARGPADTAYEHLVVEEQRREWERTKEGLGTARKQIAEKDDLILQLKTQVRKLQETLQKKDKDVRAIILFIATATTLVLSLTLQPILFALLRAPQDAELTKKLKQELIDRLVMENQQRVVNAEAIAEERKKELDRLKFSRYSANSAVYCNLQWSSVSILFLSTSSKFLRYQELEVELDEYRQEIDRLRALMSTSGRTSGVVVGKLKISAMQSSEISINSESGVRSVSMKKTPRATAQSSIRNASSTVPIASKLDDLRATKQGKLLQTKPEAITVSQKESFVTKTRRRAQEAEYYKQVRLAQLETECELEENIHIRTAREVRVRLEAEKKQREQEHEAAVIRKNIALLQQQQQQRQLTEEAEAKQQQQTMEVIAPDEPGAAQTEQEKRSEEQHGGSEAKEQFESVAASKREPTGPCNTAPGRVEESRGVPASSSPPEVPRETGAGGVGPAIKANEELDVYESFSDDSNPQQDQISVRPATVDPPAEQVGEVKRTEVERSSEQGHRDDEKSDEQKDEDDAEIKENNVKTPLLTEKSKAGVADDPLEISEGKNEDKEERDKQSDAAGAGGKSEEPFLSAPTNVPVVDNGLSDRLYEEENFDDDPNVDEREQQASTEVVEQPRQGFLVDVVDPHTRLDSIEPSEKHVEHGLSTEEHCQGFLLDVVDPHSRVTAEELQQVDDADLEAQPEAKDQEDELSNQHDPAASVEGRAPLDTVTSTKNGSLDVSSADTEASSTSGAAAAVLSEIGSATFSKAAVEGKTEEEEVMEYSSAGHIVEVKQGQPLECLATNESDAIQAQVATYSESREPREAEHASSPVDSKAIEEEDEGESKASEGAIANRIASGLETASGTSLISFVHLTAAELEEAMDAAARKIQQFWRQMDARFRRALHGEAASNDVMDSGAADSSSADAVQASLVDESLNEEEKPSAVTPSDSEASYTPYSTPRDAELDDSQSPLQESQEEADAEQ